MRRKSQPARGAVPLAAVSHGAAGGAHGSTGGAAQEGGSTGGVIGPLALVMDPAVDTITAHEGAVDRLGERTERGRRHKHGGAHLRHVEIADLTAPATPVYLVPDTPEIENESPSRIASRALKRTIDLIGAICGLVLVAPLFAMLALLVRLGSPGPAIFAQARIGRGGRVFRCYKLRTMRHDAESLLRTDPELRANYERNGFKIPCDADHRVTPIGRVLRLTSCDELPQLWNVLKGEMSLVGPRPLVARELAHYPGADRVVLLSVRPGLTGAWAVGGRSRVGYPERAAMELDYVRRWTIGRDLLILLRTVGAVLVRRGAS